MEKLHCTVKSFRFESTRSNFKVVYAVADGHKGTVAITGTLPAVASGTKMVVEGDWVVHPKYGKQFRAEKYKVVQASRGPQEDEVRHLLISGKTQSYINYYFGKAMVFDEGLVFSPRFANVFVWNDKGQICYSVVCTRPGSQSASLYFKDTKELTEKHADDVFSGLTYAQLLGVILKSEHKEPTKRRGRVLLQRLREAKQCGGKTIMVSQPSKTTPTTSFIVVPQPKKEEISTIRIDNQSHKEEPQRSPEVSKEFKADVVQALTKLGSVGDPNSIIKKYAELKGVTPRMEDVIKALDDSKAVTKDEFGIYRINTPSQKANIVKKSIPTGRSASIAPGNKILVVKKTAFSCLAKGHRIETLQTDIPVIIGGTPSYKTVNIEHCITEDKFFIFEPTFLTELYGKLGKENVLRTFVYNNKEWGMPSQRIVKLSEKSPLRLAGYNVNQQEDLSERERQAIIDYIIEFGVLDPETVKSYLSMFIDFQGRQDNMDVAISRWSDDLKYVQAKYKGNHIGKWKGKIRW